MMCLSIYMNIPLLFREHLSDMLHCHVERLMMLVIRRRCQVNLRVMGLVRI